MHVHEERKRARERQGEKEKRKERVRGWKQDGGCIERERKIEEGGNHGGEDRTEPEPRKVGDRLKSLISLSLSLSLSLSPYQILLSTTTSFQIATLRITPTTDRLRYTESGYNFELFQLPVPVSWKDACFWRHRDVSFTRWKLKKILRPYLEARWNFVMEMEAMKFERFCFIYERGPSSTNKAGHWWISSFQRLLRGNESTHTIEKSKRRSILSARPTRRYILTVFTQKF